MQVRQESIIQPTAAVSPGRNFVTLAPAQITRPTISWPGTIGKGENPQLFSTICRSLWQTPHQSNWMTTSAGPGSRRSN
jgi:hypothetical protein